MESQILTDEAKRMQQLNYFKLKSGVSDSFKDSDAKLNALYWVDPQTSQVGFLKLRVSVGLKLITLHDEGLVEIEI